MVRSEQHPSRGGFLGTRLHVYKHVRELRTGRYNKTAVFNTGEFSVKRFVRKESPILGMTGSGRTLFSDQSSTWKSFVGRS